MGFGHNEEHNHIHCGLCENNQNNNTCKSLNHKEFKGAWLAVNSLIAFILPILMAFAISFITGKSIMERFNGAILGLILGMITAFILSKLILRIQKFKD